MAPIKDAIIAIRDGDGPPVKLLRILTSKDGSYSISAPYHPAKSGLLSRMSAPDVLNPDGGGWAKPIDEHRVDVPVKLMFHSSGFIQFSAAGKVPVRSGRTPLSVPKGIGVHSQSLLDPVDTGPTWMASFFLASECEPLTGNEKQPVFLFERGDFFERDSHDLKGRHVYAVEGFVFPSDIRRDAFLGRKGWTLIHEYGVNRPDWQVEFRVLDLPVQTAFLGVTVSVRHFDRSTPGGYSLSGARDIASRQYIIGMFPADAATLPAGQLRKVVPSLEYVPDPPTDTTPA
jgi:hypothetical protein